METSTIILISVLSTLGAVAIIALVAVAFYKLGGKIEKLEDNVFRTIDETKRELITDHEEIYRQMGEIRREMDSRCDKLDNKIQKSIGVNAAGPVVNTSSTKQVLQG